MQEKARVAVLAGGGSPEHGVSLISGQGVYEALCMLGYDARLVTVESLDDLVPALRGIDVVFSVLHGGAGEDGTVQRLLEVMEIPYVGSNAQASARAMDKEAAKEQFRLLNIPTPFGVAFREGDPAVFLETAREAASYPLVVKPISTGSTLGISIARNDEDLSSAVRSCIRDYGDVLVESFVEGESSQSGSLTTSRESTFSRSSKSAVRMDSSTSRRSTPTESPSSSYQLLYPPRSRSVSVESASRHTARSGAPATPASTFASPKTERRTSSRSIPFRA